MIEQEKTPFWRDTRFFKILGQVILLLIILVTFLILGNNLVTNFQQLGLNFGFLFLIDADTPARFGIGDSLIPYQSTDPYSRAVLVGLLNSLRIMISGIILSFIIGVTIALARLSTNWLLCKIATIYIEIIRNTPLLLQLFFWYFAVFLKLPKIDNSINFLNSIYLSNQGVFLVFPANNTQTLLSVLFLIISVVLALIINRKKNQVILENPEARNTYQIILIGIAIISIIIIFIGLDWQFPQYNITDQEIEGGLHLLPEFTTLLVGLTLYTAAFIAEIVRAGIQSVSKGQWEAARALGLRPGLMMQLVIFPQALRVMIPPLTSEFLNLVKNSSLAIAVAYNDIYSVSNTISNQTGKSIEMLLVLMVTYLTINLIISAGMNRINRGVQLKER